MLFPLTALSVTGCLMLARSADGRRSPLVLGLLVWLSSIVVGPILFRYNVSYSLRADAFAAICLIATTLAYCLARRKPIEQRAPSDQRSEMRMAQVLGMIGVLGCLMLLADAETARRTLSLKYLLQNLGTVRDSQFEALARSDSQSAITIVGTYMSSCSYLTVLAAARLGRVGRLRVLASINFVLISVVSVLVYAGRSTLFNLGLLLAVSLYIRGRRLAPRKPRKPRMIAMTALGLCAVWYFSVPWITNREIGHNSHPAAILAYTQRAELRPGVDSIVGDDRALGLALVNIGYFTSPLPALAYYVEQDPVPGPLWGSYSFPLPARTIGKVMGTATPDMWLRHRQMVFSPLASTGYFPNVWTTLLRDLLVDFGYLGAVFFCAGCGAFMALARNAFERTGQLCYQFLEVFACFTFAFGAFTSVLNNTILSSAFFVALGLMLAIRSGLTDLFSGALNRRSLRESTAAGSDRR